MVGISVLRPVLGVLSLEMSSIMPLFSLALRYIYLFRCEKGANDVCVFNDMVVIRKSSVHLGKSLEFLCMRVCVCDCVYVFVCVFRMPHNML